MVSEIMKVTFCVVLALANVSFQSALANDFTQANRDLKFYDETVAKKKTDFVRLKENAKDVEWVKLKLAHMVEVDQFMRNYSRTPFEKKYSEEEKKYFTDQFMPRWTRLDVENTSELKKLLKIYDWFKISKFGRKADNDAWLLVQHADRDFEFQVQVLKILEKLYPLKETSSHNYAYLFDRVAVSQSNPSKKRLQKYGTQGHCTGPGTWEPDPVEDVGNLDRLRSEVGLEPMAEYKKRFKTICFGKQ